MIIAIGVKFIEHQMKNSEKKKNQNSFYYRLV